MNRSTRNYLALDLGASGGRAIVGRFDGERLTLVELHRFANGPVQLPRADGGTSLHWNILGLFAEIKEGLRRAAAAGNGPLTSLGIDTWGVDFGLLDGRGQLLGNPYHYRDSRTDGMMGAAFRRVPREEIFAATGIQFMQLNTLYQLLALAERQDPGLTAAATLLLTPDLLNYWLTGRALSERTIASTTQFLDPYRGQWAVDLLARLGLPTHILPPIVEPGTVLGDLLPHVAAETGAQGVLVVAPGCHDTASAVAAVPAEGAHHAYLSSGTWSLLGVETQAPVINAASLVANVTNEGGVCGTVRLLKNITGLWIIQECRRAWAAAGRPLSWDQIVAAAGAAMPATAVIDVDAAEFAAPGDMPGRVRAFCQRTGQPVPDTAGALAAVVYESLALKYRSTLARIEGLTGRTAAPLHIVGGGSQNRLLNQLAADFTGRPVIAGPVEATAIGNILMQMLATGALASLAEGRDLVRRSFEVEAFEPRPRPDRDERLGRLEALT
ncbi:MAG: rhamnulokinase [Anaerolineae bacterium]|nr:rhamnulokinase [Anaerolineae bacterium]